MLHCYGSPCPELECPGIRAPERSRAGAGTREDTGDPCALPGPHKAAGFGSGGLLGSSRLVLQPLPCLLPRVLRGSLVSPHGNPLLGREVAAVPDVLIGDRQVRGSHARGVLGTHTHTHTHGSAPQKSPPNPYAAPKVPGIVPEKINPKLICRVGVERVRPCSQPL